MAEKLTIGELRLMLMRFDDSTPIVFQPAECCGGGIPTWEDCRLREQTRYGPNDEEEPTGTVVCELNGECE